jgi:hypothetical protein
MQKQTLARETSKVARTVKEGKSVKVVSLDNIGSGLLPILMRDLSDLHPLLDNIKCEMDPRNTTSRNKLVLVDEAISMFSSSNKEHAKAAYVISLQRLLKNGSTAVFALHREKRDAEDEFDKTFPGCERVLVSAQLPLHQAMSLITSQSLSLNGNSMRIKEGDSTQKFLEISGRSQYFIERTLIAIRDSIECIRCSAERGFVLVTADMIDKDRIISKVSRELCPWITKLNPEELSFLSEILAGKDPSCNSSIIAELIGLGILKPEDGKLTPPGSAVRESFRRSIEMVESAI